MKRSIGACLALVIVLGILVAMASPALASVPTSVTLSGGQGAKPMVLAVWETPDSNSGKMGTQIAPAIGWGATSPMCFWAVVYNNPVSAVSQVAVDVTNPDLPLLGKPPAANTFKFQVILSPLSPIGSGGITSAQASAAIAQFDSASTAGLVTLTGNPMPGNETVDQLLGQGEAYIWTNCYYMECCEPAGTYTAQFWAKNLAGNDPALDLTNTYEYVAATMAEADFTSVNYGSLTATTNGSADGVVSGDSCFNNPGGGPTIRNIGNTWWELQIQQDDMGFGQSQPGNTWNVSYDCRVGSLIDIPVAGDPNGQPTVFNPAEFKGSGPLTTGWTTIPGIVELCNVWKVDFSIHVVKFTGTSYSGTMWLQTQLVPFSSTLTNGVQVDHPGAC